MAGSYSGDPSASQRDKLRFLIQDCGAEPEETEGGDLEFEFADQEIDAQLSDTVGRIYRCAAILCRLLAARYAAERDRADQGLDIKASTRSVRYATMAKEYDALDAEVTLRTGPSGGDKIVAAGVFGSCQGDRPLGGAAERGWAGYYDDRPYCR